MKKSQNHVFLCTPRLSHDNSSEFLKKISYLLSTSIREKLVGNQFMYVDLDNKIHGLQCTSNLEYH